MKRLIYIVPLLLSGCPPEQPPCDEASLAKLVKDCGPTKEACHTAIEDRERACGKRIVEESNQ